MNRDPIKVIARVIFSILVTGLILILAGCSNYYEEYQYETHCNRPGLLELRGKKVLLLTFEYDKDLISSSSYDFAFEPYNPQVVVTVSEIQKKAFLSTLNSYFNLVDVSNNASVLQDRRPGLENPEINKQIIQEQAADGAILIQTGYGYGQELGPMEILLRRILPKDIMDVLTYSTDSAALEVHFSASNINILNKDGQSIWNFYGIAQTDPGSVPGSNAEKFATTSRRMSVSVPFPFEIERFMSANFDVYSKYMAWLLDMDLAGISRKNYFTDYLGGKRPVHTDVYPTNHQTFIKVRSMSERVEDKKQAKGILGLWEKARSSRWGVFGEWKQAGASLILLLGSLVLILISYGLVSYLLEKLGEERTGCLVSLLIIAAIVSTLVSLYYLLKAIF